MGREPSIRLVPLKCPRCSNDIGIGANDRAFFCRRCLSLWKQEEGRLVEGRLTWIEGSQTASHYIPFWVFRMTADTPLGRIDDFFSYMHHIAFAESIGGIENRPLFLYVLAAALSVERYRLSASREFTYTQPILTRGRPTRGHVWGPCIDEHAAANYARVIFISTLSGERKESGDFIGGLTINLETPELLYIPFQESPNDYRDSAEIATISKKIIDTPAAELIP